MTSTLLKVLAFAAFLNKDAFGESCYGDECVLGEDVTNLLQVHQSLQTGDEREVDNADAAGRLGPRWPSKKESGKGSATASNAAAAVDSAEGELDNIKNDQQVAMDRQRIKNVEERTAASDSARAQREATRLTAAAKRAVVAEKEMRQMAAAVNRAAQNQNATAVQAAQAATQSVAKVDNADASGSVGPGWHAIVHKVASHFGKGSKTAATGSIAGGNAAAAVNSAEGALDNIKIDQQEAMDRQRIKNIEERTAASDSARAQHEAARMTVAAKRAVVAEKEMRETAAAAEKAAQTQNATAVQAAQAAKQSVAKAVDAHNATNAAALSSQSKASK